MNFLKRMLISTIVVLLLSYFLTGVQVDKVLTAVIVALVMSLLNTFVKPIIVFFTLPVTVVTLGLFLLVINAFLVLVCAYMVEGFKVDTFFTAMLFSILMSITNWALYNLIKD